MAKDVRERDFEIPLKKYKDVDLCFKRNPITGDIAVKKDERAIEQALKNVMLTRKGEKPFAPNVGSNISDILFEPMDAFSADRLERELIDNVGQFDERIRIIDVEVREDRSESGYICRIDYRIIGEPIVEQLNFVLKRPGS